MALEAKTEKIRESISADSASGVASYSAVGSYSASPAPSSAPSSSHPSLENQQDISVIFAINQELDQIRAKKNELRETMSALSLEEFNISKVLEYLETSCYDNKNDGIDGFVYDDAALLPILERVLVLDKSFEVSFVVGKTYKV